MNSRELMAYLIPRQVESFLSMVKRVPEDKLDWVPHPGLRSARDQFQEVATILEFTWDLFTKRELAWDPDAFVKFKAHRQQFHSVAELEAELRRQTAMLLEFVAGLSEDDFDLDASVPWPGPHKMADSVNYHPWNLAYHEGQIAALLMQLDIDPMG